MVRKSFSGDYPRYISSSLIYVCFSFFSFRFTKKGVGGKEDLVMNSRSEREECDGMNGLWMTMMLMLMIALLLLAREHQWEVCWREVNVIQEWNVFPFSFVRN